MSRAALEVFGRIVADDATLAHALWTREGDAFVAAVVSEAGARGLDVTPDDVAEVLHERAHAWLMRWIS